MSQRGGSKKLLVRGVRNDHRYKYRIFRDDTGVEPEGIASVRQRKGKKRLSVMRDSQKTKKLREEKKRFLEKRPGAALQSKFGGKKKMKGKQKNPVTIPNPPTSLEGEKKEKAGTTMLRSKSQKKKL